MVCDIRAAVKVQESLAEFHTHDAQDSVFTNGLARNAYEAILTHEGTIVVWRETLRAGVNLVASDVVRHTFNRYHVQLMTSKKNGRTQKCYVTTSRYTLLQGHMRVGYSPQYIYYELLVLFMYLVPVC